MRDHNYLGYEGAAAAGRMVVVLLFLANAAAYLASHYRHDVAEYSVAGMLCAIGAGACGYFACSDAAFADDPEDAGQKITLASILLCVVSGVLFLMGA